MKCNKGLNRNEVFMDFFWKKNAKAPTRLDDKWILREEKRMIKKTRSTLELQKNWVKKESKNLSFFTNNSSNLYKKDFKIQTDSIEDEIDDMLSKIPGRKRMTDDILAFMGVAMKRGGNRIVKDLDMKKRFGISYFLGNPLAQKFLEEKEDWELSNNRGNITGTTKEGLKKVLVEAHATGASYTDTAKKIQGLADSGVFSLARAQLIATREIGVAYEEGNAEVMDEFLVKYPKRSVVKYWQTVNDSRVTETHRANQSDGWIGYNETFSGTGDDHAPGSDNPRCRCFTKYEIPKK